MGHVPNYAHVAGRSYGKATLRALNRDPVRHVMGESIPSPPHANPKITVVDTSPGHIPGYAGHVTGLQYTHGGTYAACTASCPTGDAVSGFNGLRSKHARKAFNAHALVAALHYTPLPSSVAPQ